MILPRFELYQPKSLDEALGLASEHPKDFDYIAGGTDLLQNYKQRLNHRGHVISLLEVPGLSGVRPAAGKDTLNISIGALTTLSEVADHQLIRERFPALSEAAAKVATPLVRNMGTLGGNLLVETRCYYFNQSYFWRDSKHFCLKAEGKVCLVVPQDHTCYAVFSGDTPPALMVLGASVKLHGPDGERVVKVKDVYRGDGIERHVIQKQEIVTEVLVPEGASQFRSGYRKLRLRDAFDYPALGVAASLRVEKGQFTHLSVALGAVATIPLLCDEATGSFVGRDTSGSTIGEIAEAVQELSQPVKNVMSLSVRYRKRMVGVFVRRLLTDLTT